ncbi:MAG: TrkH family potassium uptake protein, partial [Bacteroidota bacterium]
MLTTIPFSLLSGEHDELALLICSALTLLTGGWLWWSKRKVAENIGKREGYLIVSFAWIAMAIFSALPYLASGVFDNLSDAFFESVSGLTTTGASVLEDIEAVPPGILFWRSLTQWIGGMGIIVLTVAIFPILGIGGVELFVAEAPGPTSSKIHPRIKETAKRLWLIYVGLTVLLTAILYFEGMIFFDAINHGLTTMATGGFSTKNASIAYFEAPLIQYTVLLFMFLAGMNYTLIYHGLKGDFKKVWASDEFKTYLSAVLLFIIGVTLFLQLTYDWPLEQTIREVAFQVVSLITTTGFVLADYTTWHPALTLFFFLLLFVGACAGSTAGGIKIIRHLVLVKNTVLEFRRILHPNSLIRTKIDKQLVQPHIMTHILTFLLIYMVIFFAGSIIMTFILSDFQQPLLTAFGAVATALGNVGPGIGEVGPVNNFSAIPESGKWFLSFLMLLGRLELFTILVLFM